MSGIALAGERWLELPKSTFLNLPPDKRQHIKKELGSLPEAANLFDLLLAAAPGGLKMARDHPQLQRLGDRLLHESDEFLAQVMAGFGDVGDATYDGELDSRCAQARQARQARSTPFGGVHPADPVHEDGAGYGCRKDCAR